MIILLYLRISCLFIWVDAVDAKRNVMRHDEIDGDVARRSVEETKFQKTQAASQQNQPNNPMVLRDSWQRNDKYGTGYPQFMQTFIQSLGDGNVLNECKSAGFSCVKFPDDVMKYLAGIGQTDVHKLGTFQTTPAPTTILSTFNGPTKHLDLNTKKLSAYMFKYNDPEWWRQWDMQDYRTSNIPVMDHNVVPVHAMGYSGNKVTIAVLGHGIREHSDLGDGLDKELSYNFCDDVQVQYPKYWLTLTGYAYESLGNYHAGVIAMNAGNEICGVGIAPKANIAAYKVKGCDEQKFIRKLESRSLNFQSDKIDIFCNTWTVNDELGSLLYPMSKDVQNSLARGISTGRGSYGSIYVFPSGRNRAVSNCATNGYINNPYVITIASANQQGKPASYSERCSAVFATAYSGDAGLMGLGTIDANGQCAVTPSDLPMGATVASGIIALLLESKPSLTFRDVMHIIAMTAEVAPLADNTDTWYRNARGFWVSRDFGFGLLNTKNMVDLAKNWKKVPDKRICLLRKQLDEPLYFDHKESKKVVIDATVCKGQESGIIYLEHIEVNVTATYHFRGAIYLNITSPGGTVTTLLDPRVKDWSKEGFVDWNIMSTQYWGENPKGPWTITVNALEIYDVAQPQGNVKEFILKLHGLHDKPGSYPRKYAAFRLPNGKTNQYL